jgi:HSP20 family protein
MFGSLTNFDGLFEEFRPMEQQMDEIDIYLFASGIDPTSIDLNIEQNLLTVAGERRVPVNENAMYYRQERFSDLFRRVIALPDNVDPDRVEAKTATAFCRSGRNAAHPSNRSTSPSSNRENDHG